MGIIPDGPADRAGIRVQDVITAIDGHPVAFADAAEALGYFLDIAPGRVFVFSVIRRSQKMEIRVRAVVMPQQFRQHWLESRKRAKVPPVKK